MSQAAPATAPQDQQRARALHRLLLHRGAERARHRAPVLQLRHRPCADHRGDGGPAQARREGAERDALPAREHRGAHGDGLCGGDRPRPGRAGACRRRHRQHRQRDAQPVPQPPAGAADVGQGALHLQQRAGRLARHLRAFRAGADRPGLAGAALHEMGMDAAVRRRGEGGAAPRPHHHGDEAGRPGLFHGAARDADAAVGQRPDPQLRGRPVLAAAGRRRRPGADRAARRQAHRRRASDPDLRLCRAIEERAEADRGAGDVRRHRGVRRQPDLQHLARIPVLPRLLAEQASAEGRRRPAGRCRRAVVPGRRDAQGQVVLGAYRRRHAEVGVADVDVPRQPADAGRLRRHPRPVAGGAEEEGDAEVQGSRREARRGAHRRAQGVARAGARRWRPTRASKARSTRTTCSPS